MTWWRFPRIGKVGGPGGYPGGRLPIREARQARRKAIVHNAIVTTEIIVIEIREKTAGNDSRETSNFQAVQTNLYTRYESLAPKAKLQGCSSPSSMLLTCILVWMKQGKIRRMSRTAA